MNTSPKSARRSLNFSKDEEHLLISLVDRYKNILENKKSDVNTWKEKEKAWQTVEEVFNSQCSSNGRRSAKVLKEKFRNLKRKMKEKFSRVKVEINKTGGGQYVPPLITDVEEAVKNIIGNIQVAGIPNSYDCDASSTEKTTQENNAVVSNMDVREVEIHTHPFEEAVPIDLGTGEINFEIVDIATGGLSTQCLQDSENDPPQRSLENLGTLLETERPRVDKRKSGIHLSPKESTYAKKIKLAPIKTPNDQLNNNNSSADHDWSTYCPKNLKTPVSSKLQIQRSKNQGETHEVRNQGKKQGRKNLSINAQLIEEKLEFVRLQKEKFLEEHAIKIKILQKQLEVLEQGCKCYQRCMMET